MPTCRPRCVLVRSAWPLVLLAAGFVMLPLQSEADTISLAWDASSQPAVTGYRVYVGTEAGVYQETFDLPGAQRTRFDYLNATPGVRYYLAVAAMAGARVGPRSAEVSGFASGTAPPRYRWPIIDDDPGYWVRAADGALPERSITCDPRGTACHAVSPVAQGLGEIGSLALAPDGTLFFVESRRFLRVINQGLLADRPALVMDATVEATALAVDPAFAQSGTVFVGEARARGTGHRDLTIARYRAVGPALGERAAIVSGLQLPPASIAALALDADRHLYVAMPSRDTDGRSNDDPYGGHVLRFTNDGAVPRTNRAASPIVSAGLVVPSALLASPQDSLLWLAGGDAGLSPSVVSLDPSAADASIWPRQPRAIALPAAATSTTSPDALALGLGMDGVPHVYVIASDASILSLSLDDADDRTPEFVLDLRRYGLPVAVAAASNGQLHVAIRTPDARYAILRIEPLASLATPLW